MALGLAGLVLASAVVLAAPGVRQHGDLTVALSGGLVYPRWTTPLFLGLIVLTIAMLHTASLHLAPWVRVLGLVGVVLAIFAVTLDPPDQGMTANVVSWVGSGLVVLFTVARWRGSFRWWEFVVSLVLVGGTVGVVLHLVALDAQPLGVDVTPVAMVLLLQLASALAVPFTFVAGVAFAQLAMSLAHRVGDVVEERVRPTPVVAVVTSLLAVGAVALAVRRLRLPTQSGHSHAAELGAGAALLAVTLLVALLVVVPAAPPGSRALDGLEGAVSRVALPIAFLVVFVTFPNLLVRRIDSEVLRLSGADHLRLDELADFFTKGWVTTWSRVLIGLLLVAWAVWQRRRQPLPSLVAAAVGTTLVVTMTGRATSYAVELPWTDESLNDVAALAAVTTLLGLALTRRLDRRRLLALGVALGVSLAFSVRSTFDAPFVALLGLGATAAVFLGLWWAVLTDADDANGESPRLPRPARVLFFLANALLAMTTLAFASVARTSELGIDISAFATLGDAYLGTGLLLAAYAVLAWEVLTARASPRC